LTSEERKKGREIFADTSWKRSRQGEERRKHCCHFLTPLTIQDQLLLLNASDCKPSPSSSIIFFLFPYIISLDVHEIQLLLDPNTSIATLSNTLAQNSNLLLASSFTCNNSNN
jgi:hypothetical protein